MRNESARQCRTLTHATRHLMRIVMPRNLEVDFRQPFECLRARLLLSTCWNSSAIAMFCGRVSHGYSAFSWNIRVRCGCGPRTGYPSASILPLPGVSKPAAPGLSNAEARPAIGRHFSLQSSPERCLAQCGESCQLFYPLEQLSGLQRARDPLFRLWRMAHGQNRYPTARHQCLQEEFWGQHSSGNTIVSNLKPPKVGSSSPRSNYWPGSELRAASPNSEAEKSNAAPAEERQVSPALR